MPHRIHSEEHYHESLAAALRVPDHTGATVFRLAAVHTACVKKPEYLGRPSVGEAPQRPSSRLKRPEEIYSGLSLKLADKLEYADCVTRSADNHSIGYASFYGSSRVVVEL